MTQKRIQMNSLVIKRNDFIIAFWWIGFQINVQKFKVGLLMQQNQVKKKYMQINCRQEIANQSNKLPNINNIKPNIKRCKAGIVCVGNEIDYPSA